MANLNADAPLFIPSRPSLLTSSSNSFTIPNPNPNPNPNLNANNYYYPIYLKFHYTPFETSLIYSLSPFPIIYNYYNYYIQYPQPVQPSCTIEEIDENLDEILDSDRNFRVSRRNSRLNSIRPKKRRSSSKNRRPHLEINGEDDFDERTTVMIKNIPPEVTKGEMLTMLDESCMMVNQAGGIAEFDFFYLPIDFKTGGNFGYALVNFTSPMAVRKIYSYFHGYSWDHRGSDKICKVNYAHQQGLRALVKRANTLQFKRIPDEYMPSRFDPPRNGITNSTEELLGIRDDNLKIEY